MAGRRRSVPELQSLPDTGASRYASLPLLLSQQLLDAAESPSSPSSPLSASAFRGSPTAVQTPRLFGARPLSGRAAAAASASSSPGWGEAALVDAGEAGMPNGCTAELEQQLPAQKSFESCHTAAVQERSQQQVSLLKRAVTVITTLQQDVDALCWELDRRERQLPCSGGVQGGMLPAQPGSAEAAAAQLAWAPAADAAAVGAAFLVVTACEALTPAQQVQLAGSCGLQGGVQPLQWSTAEAAAAQPDWAPAADTLAVGAAFLAATGCEAMMPVQQAVEMQLELGTCETAATAPDQTGQPPPLVGQQRMPAAGSSAAVVPATAQCAMPSGQACMDAGVQAAGASQLPLREVASPTASSSGVEASPPLESADALTVLQARPARQSRELAMSWIAAGVCYGHPCTFMPLLLQLQQATQG